METREKSEEINALNDLTLNENQPVAEDVTVDNNQPEAEEVAAPESVETPTEPEAVEPEPATPEVAPEVEAEVEEVAEVEAEVVMPEAIEDEVEEPQLEDEGRKLPQTIDEVIEALVAISEKDADEISRDEVTNLRRRFHDLRKAADKAALDEFVAAGNSPEAFEAPVSADDEKFQALVEQIKEKKAARAAEVEAELQSNFEKKDALIAELLSMGDDVDNVNRSFPRFREIQAEFKAIGEVPPQQMTNQWKRYQEAVEHFYDQLKVNKDLRDYDFKKNLETKNHLIAEAEALDAESDIVVAFRRLQDLHIKWRETGPVAKEIREEIWAKFKDASAVVNKKYQTFFEERKQREEENEAAKTAICERVEALDFESLKSFNAWNEMTKVILEAQEEWKKLGFASRKANNALFARFRTVCDKFFNLKAEYYRSVKDDHASNLEKKIALCEQAEALKDSTDWKATADKLVELQKQWKQIGAVAKKHSDAVWARFQKACDYFFEQKKKDFSDTRHTEQANLKAKRALTAELKAIAPDAAKEDVLAAIRDAQARWGQIGHVPFREKDKVYEEFRAAINELYKVHDLRETRANFARFENSISEITDENKLLRERERLARVLEQKRSDLVTYQNNLGFFNFKSASSSSMLRDIERKTQRIKDDIEELEKKIRVIDEKL